ncbi:S8 family peptidase [Bacillus infantis]|uniref:S8 family peptidase n=1 Tax=Bacillus infantis TaxID=324767 RepID=UPI000B9BA4E4|nr:S8 family peptidase [Bacillus infantis]MCK6207084.1 S8 family peptidase [Bacillus infantis]OXT15143.1 peptidase S8 [Bacillus sp. OG2]
MEELFLFPAQVEMPAPLMEHLPMGVAMINAHLLWPDTFRGLGNVTAVIDSGCDIAHPDLKENIIGVYNFTDDDGGDPGNVTDYAGHGTHVSGIIAARQTPDGFTGVAPESKLLILKVINKDGQGSYEHLNRALEYVREWNGPSNERVSVINLSLGGMKENHDLHDHLRKLNMMGIITVCSSGNYGDSDPYTNEIMFPANYKEVLQIGAVDFKGSLLPFSNSNYNVDFVAPGYKILSTYLNASYREMTGTSMAAPHVAGLIALALNRINRSEPELINSRIYNYLIRNSKKLGYPFNSEGFGLVRINNGKA